VQARWLSRRLEVHLLGNHLFANAKALVFAGLFFEGPEADEWLRCGATIIARELDEQVLPDGGQFERSTMYHALALEDVLDLINVSQTLGERVEHLTRLESILRTKAEQMISWLRCMVHPSGQLARFNDCSDGIAPNLTELETYAQRLGLACRPVQALSDHVVHLAASGYVRVVRGPITAMLDVAPVGPDYLPAHAHADTLSYELSLGVTRLIVNGGTSCYGAVPRRSYERGTSAHNTVEVAGEDSSEVWSSFRVGRRAKLHDLEINEWRITCSHDGYGFLPGAPVHRRSWSFSEIGMVVEDEVSPPTAARARYFLAPGLRMEPIGADKWRVINAASWLADVEVLLGHPLVERCVQAQSFGALEEVDCLTVHLVEGKACTAWAWVDHAHTVSH
jgi:uncharacterized heparinase superfamily protein